MISRALAVSAGLAIGAASQASSPPAVEGKVVPAISQEYFEPEAKAPPRLLPLAIRETLPGKYTPPTAMLIPAEFGANVLHLANWLSEESQSLARRSRKNQSVEPPLVQIP